MPLLYVIYIQPAYKSVVSCSLWDGRLKLVYKVNSLIYTEYAEKRFKMANKLRITLVKSPIGAIPKHKATVEALGLKKMHKTVELPDNEAVRGMVWHVRHLVEVEEI